MIQGKCPLISIPLIKKSMSPWKTSPSAAVSFLQTDCVFSFEPRELGFSEQTGGVCIEVDGKQIQLLYLTINALKQTGGKTTVLNRGKHCQGAVMITPSFL